jgi:hypothetical protein
MAVGIDLGFVALEASQLAAMGEKVRRQIARWARPAIIGTVIGSAGMNAFAFAAHTTTVWMTSAAGQSRSCLRLGACLSNRWILLARVGRVRFCLAHEQDVPTVEDR